jgi:hypothetical protein
VGVDPKTGSPKRADVTARKNQVGFHARLD